MRGQHPCFLVFFPPPPSCFDSEMGAEVLRDPRGRGGEGITYFMFVSVVQDVVCVHSRGRTGCAGSTMVASLAR